MKIWEDTRYRRRLLVKLRERMSGSRTGVHVSDLILCIRKSWLERNAFTPQDRDLLVWLRGQSHENLLREEHPGPASLAYCLSCSELLRPEETCCPSCGDTPIVGTVDWTRKGMPVEAKSTMKSSRADLYELAHYADQALTYALMRGKNEARVVVYHVNGNWKGDTDPVLRVWRVQFDPGEKEELRRTLLRRKAKFESDTMPPLDEDSPVYSWICKYCTFDWCPMNPRSDDYALYRMGA